MPEFLLLRVDEIERIPLGTTYQAVAEVPLTGHEILERLREAFPSLSISGISVNQENLTLRTDLKGEFIGLVIGDWDIVKKQNITLADQPLDTIE